MPHDHVPIHILAFSSSSLRAGLKRENFLRVMRVAFTAELLCRSFCKARDRKFKPKTIRHQAKNQVRFGSVNGGVLKLVCDGTCEIKLNKPLAGPPRNQTVFLNS